MPAPEAHAPFNFVPQGDPIGWPIEPDTQEETYSGTLSVRIEALEPILVSGEQQPEAVRRFTMRNGRPFIAGSGIKGAVRSMLEALSISRLHPISPRRVFFRDLDSPKYLERFVEADGDVSVYRSRAGYLRKVAGEWCVVPCAWAKVSHEVLEANGKGTRFFKRAGKPKEQVEALLRCATASKGVAGGPPPMADHRHPKPKNPHLMLRYRKLGSVTFDGPGRIVTAGHMEGRHFEAVFYPPQPDAKPISAHHAWDDFEAWLDLHKPRRALFRLYQSKAAREYYTEGVPVFWIEAADSSEANPRLEAFGFSQLFCVPYRRSIEDLVETRGGDEPLSLAEQIFGYADLRVGGRSYSRRGRVAFGPAHCGGEFKELHPVRVIPGNPSATCLGLYLQQVPAEKVKRDSRSHGLVTYDHLEANLEAKLRGRKVYWHRPGAWTEMAKQAAPGKDSVSAEYAPLDKGVQFTTVVTVDRLTKLELGALVASIDLPTGHAHKIGLGKSFGLGSVRLAITSHTIRPDRERYSSLRTNAGGSSIAGHELLTDCNSTFVAAMEGICGGPFETLPEIRELRALTDYDRAPSWTATEFMKLQRPHKDDRVSKVYANKPVLPTAAVIAARHRQR